jgi:hypothetical protein
MALCTGESALADVASEARFFDDAGRRAYDAGKYELALEAFQLVQEIAPSERMLYNIALCADLAKRGDMAFSLYNEYLRTGDADPTRRARAAERAEQLKHKLALIEVQTEPVGATVYVDRKELGQFGVTPVTLAVPDGAHRLLIEESGFAPAAVSVTAKTGSLVSVMPSLEPLYGRLVVNVTPGNATLSFVREGKPSAGTEERGGYRLQVGRYQVLATAPGYAPGEGQVVVTDQGSAELDFSLSPLPHSTGVLLVSTGKVPAEVFVDGKRVAVTPATLRELALGRHTLEVRGGGQSASRSIDITEKRPTYVEVELGGSAP